MKHGVIVNVTPLSDTMIFNISYDMFRFWFKFYARIYLLKVNNENQRTMREIFSKKAIQSNASMTKTFAQTCETQLKKSLRDYVSLSHNFIITASIFNAIV